MEPMETHLPQHAVPRVTVVFSIHDRSGYYWLYLAVALTSLMIHARTKVSLVVLHDESLNSSQVSRLRGLVDQLGAQPARFYQIELPAALMGLEFGVFTPASLYRLLIPRLCADEDLVLYLDADLVLNGVDVAELAAAVPIDAPIAAVIDPYIHLSPGQNEQLRRLGLDGHSYVNSGVLAFRPRLISGDLMEDFVTFGKMYGAVSHPDQDFLNYRFKSQIHQLPSKFNLQACTYNRSLLQPLAHYEGRIVHYAGKLKPLDGMLAPGFLPFWRYTFHLPEIARYPGQTGVSRYLYPVAGDPHGVRRVVMREQMPTAG